MSTGANCSFYEEKPGKWYYKLQCYPYGATEDYDKYGPFGTFRQAMEHLDSHHANPGGFSTHALPGCPHDLIVPPRNPESGWARVCCDRCGTSWEIKEWQALQTGPDLDWEVTFSKYDDSKRDFTHRTEIIKARTHRQAGERSPGIIRKGERLYEIKQVPRSDNYTI